ncbi:anti-sigma factor [Sphingomonas sp.]|uniref:anti-sigma factor family protein n=1 Tax=Sphingomonas sp. TaxID=28214 RepID=UPI00333FBE2B
MIDEETIFAYIDGELGGEERTRIEALIDADPALRAMVAEHRALAGRLQSGFATLLEAPIPPVLLAQVAAGDEVRSLAAARHAREQRRTVWTMPYWGALAATLVAGLIGGAAFSGGREGPVTEHGGRLLASGRLEHALDTQLASTQGANPAIRIGLTFKNQHGAICRSFAAEIADGVACHQGKWWQLQGLLGHDPSPAGAYRMAASPGTGELIDRLIDGDALDQAQERAALAANWAPPKTR